MSLPAGSRIGPYEVVAPLGAGGMGEVYRARDARLGRDVAIKILPPALTSDVDRLARFEREARVLASLTHPHIAALYGLEEQDGQRALVLELVEGQTLAELIRARGRLPAPDALALARQIADAFDAAHDRGIVHRDLKPANVKITPDGVVKVLDFGLAKAATGSGPLTGESTGATLADTREGVIVGTAAYMSPEQARGQAVDKRTDVWAFGCVLYEMLTGRVAFHGETMSDIIARILGATPEWTALPAETPRGVRRLLERCLERDVKRRLRDLGDIDLALESEAAPAVTHVARGTWRGWGGGAAAGALAVAAAVLAIDRWAEPPVEAPLVRFDVAVSQRGPDSNASSVSPDGRRLVFLGTGADGVLRIWVHSLDTNQTRPLSGSEGEVAFNTSPPFWSPDGRTLAFYANGRIKRIDSQGGAVETVCHVPTVAVGGTWGARNIIVVGNTGGGLLQCPALGGQPSPVTQAGSAPGVVHFFPVFLPDGRRLIYLRLARANPSENGVYLADLDRAPESQATERLVATGFNAGFVTASNGAGHILFVRDQTLWSVPFDPGRAVVVGDPIERAGPVGAFRDGAFFSATRTVLATRGQAPDVVLTWFDRQGKTLGTAGEPGYYAGVALSPDATRAAVLRETRVNRADQDLWVIDLARNATTRLTSEPLLESIPTWSVDGTALIFALGHGQSNVLSQPLDGSPSRTILAAGDLAPRRINPFLTTLSSTPDGRWVVVTAEGDAESHSDLWLLSLATSGRAVPLLQQQFDQTQGVMSPDGRWLAYVSNESGANEVFLRRMAIAQDGTPTVGAPTVVSRGGGRSPRWRRDGRELFFQSPSGGLMAVSVADGGPGQPAELFRAPGMLAHWDVTADGQRFLLGLPASQGPSPFHLVLNWQSAASR